jgi:hypothetical protein
MEIVCVRCQRGGLAESEVSMSGDGWLCDACFKAWNREEEKKQPKPWLFAGKKRLDVDDLPVASEDDFKKSKRTRALKWLAGGAGLMLGGGVASLFVYDWWVNGGVLPKIVLAGPFAVVVGAVLILSSLRDLRKG